MDKGDSQFAKTRAEGNICCMTPRDTGVIPVFIYDADCGFCTTSAGWLAKKDSFELRAWQFVEDLSAIGLNYDMVTTAAHWVVDGKVVASGSNAIAMALISRGGLWRILGNIISFPFIRPAAGFVYRKVAVNRHKMPGGTAACKL